MPGFDPLNFCPGPELLAAVRLGPNSGVAGRFLAASLAERKPAVVSILPIAKQSGMSDQDPKSSSSRRGRRDGETAAQQFTDQLIRAAGVLLVRGRPGEDVSAGSNDEPAEFLLMKHRRRWDLPKGHVDPGETEFETAVRELEEETGISRSDIEFLEPFQYEIFYVVRERQFSPDPLPKRVTFYLARLIRDVEIVVSEHQGFEWIPWSPPHQIQKQTVDPLLGAAEKFFAERAGGGAAAD